MFEHAGYHKEGAELHEEHSCHKTTSSVAVTAVIALLLLVIVVLFHSFGVVAALRPREGSQHLLIGVAGPVTSIEERMVLQSVDIAYS